MKITDIKTFLVGAGGRNWVYVKILTDQGIYGIGEAYSAGPDEATVKVIEDFKLWLVGNDPRNVQYLFDVMYNTTRFPGGLIVNSAISGIEHALVGYRRQIRGRAGVGAARRPCAQQDPRLPEHRRRDAPAGRRKRQSDDREVRLHGAEDGNSSPGRHAVQPGHPRHGRARAGGARSSRSRCRHRR